MNEERPFQRLQDRLAGLPVDRTLHPGVPHWLVTPLRNWLDQALTEPLAQRVALRLQKSPYRSSYIELLAHAEDAELLTIVDATLQLHSGWDAREDAGTLPRPIWTPTKFRMLLHYLDLTLTDAASQYRVDFDSRSLVRRVDETVQKAADATVKDAPAASADHLRAAWVAAYGLNPDPDKVFNESIRAVEEVACPLVEERRAAQGGATLGTVISELGKNSGHRWELTLSGKDGQPRDIESLVAMLQTLWQAHVSRHGGAPKSRRQNQDEAEAALHLAVLLVQWLNAGVLRRKL